MQVIECGRRAGEGVGLLQQDSSLEGEEETQILLRVISLTELLFPPCEWAGLPGYRWYGHTKKKEIGGSVVWNE